LNSSVLDNEQNNHPYKVSSNDSANNDTFSSFSTRSEVAIEKPITKSTTLLSRITTVKFDDSQIVPKKDRRGLLHQLCLIPEYQDARNLPPSLRRTIVFIIAFCAMLGPMGTSILLPASDDAVENLHTTITILNVAIGVYLITLGVIPLWWSHLSERHGRRSIYIISFILYLCFTIGCALSKNVNTLIGFRILSGGCAASVQSVGAGTIGDLYPITKRGAAMGLFYLGPLAGPLLSPIIGGAITSNPKFGWRATQWFLICLSGGCCLLIILFLPETLRKQDNREAIRQILRERRSHKISKVKDEENKDDKILSEDAKPGSLHGSINRQPVPSTHLPLSPVNSVESNVIDDDVSVNEEEVEHLNRLLTRISTRRSFASVVNNRESGNKSRKGSVTSQITNNNTQLENQNESGYPINDAVTSSDDEKQSLNENESLYSDDEEMPVMDSVVPLSKIPTTNTANFKPNNKKRKEFVINQLDHLHELAHGNKFKLFLHYAKMYLFGPLKGFVFIKYPPVFLAIAYSAPCFAALYVQNMTLTYMYSRDPYNFSSVLIGLVYIPNSVTYFIASIWGGKFNDYLLKKKIEKYGVIAPEARFGINVYVAAALLPCSMLITGWCLEYGEQWVTPLIGTALFGFAQMIVIGVTVTYLADCLPGKGATGVALNNFIRMIMAAGVSFATEPLIKAIGVGVLFSICAGVTAALSILLVIIIKYGDYWRETFDLEKLYDYVDG
jgi:multidrug resistance protein